MTRDKLVEKMAEAYMGIMGFRQEVWMVDRPSMSAALDVAVGELRIKVLEQRCERGIPYDIGVMEAAKAVESYLKPKTVEERVTVEQNSLKNWLVIFDGKRQPDFAFSQRENAEIYRLGLIQKLKEKSE